VVDPRIGKTMCWGLCQEAFFSGAIVFVQLCWVSVKGYHVRGLPVGNVRVAYVDGCGKCMCRVYQASLAGCTFV
jgi:hypothetical protein